MRVEKLTFPVMAVSQGNVEVWDSAEWLQAANSLALRRGYYKGLRLIDGEGRSFKVKQVTTHGGAGPFWGFRFMKPRLLRIRVVLEQKDDVPFEEVRRIAMKAVRNNPDFYGSTDVDFPRAIKAANSVTELFSLFR